MGRLKKMKINLVSIEIEYFPGEHTCILNLLELDWCEENSSLFEIGWYQGNFYFDILFFSWFRTKYEEYIERKLY